MTRRPVIGSAPREAHRLPGAAAVDRPSAALPAGLLRQRDAAFQRGLQASELVEDLDRALKDRPLDTGDLFTDPGVGLGRGRTLQPSRSVSAGPESVSREVRTTATTSTDRPRSLSACQRPRCASPHERSAVEVSCPGST